ncbi:MAG: hypothetical protein AB8F74_10800, partial [Saprospiraceae bacterium]
MAVISRESLSVGRTGSAWVDIIIRYRINFSSSEVGTEYTEEFDLHPYDSGPFIPKKLIHLKADDILIAESGNMDREHKYRLTRTLLNEDKNSKDEIFSFIAVKPVARTAYGKTPI